jgi:hypothetical protein
VIFSVHLFKSFFVKIVFWHYARVCQAGEKHKNCAKKFQENCNQLEVPLSFNLSIVWKNVNMKNHPRQIYQHKRQNEPARFITSKKPDFFSHHENVIISTKNSLAMYLVFWFRTKRF